MGSAFFGLSTATSALIASQLALDTSAHNTANASTPGYSRQRVNLVAAPPFTFPAFNRSGMPGQIGTGVTVASITRVRDAFLDLQLRGQISLGGYWDSTRDELSKVESVFPEPSGSGLGNVISRFWDAWHDVAADPTSTASRSAMIEQASTLAARFNRDAGQLSTLIEGIDFQVGERVATINDLAARIAGLNEQIRRVAVSGDHPNDLADQRDDLLDQLNQILSVTVEPQADGTVSVLVAGTDLVSGDRARPVTTILNGAGHLVPAWTDGSRVDLGQGQLAALTAVRDTTLAGYATKLDQLAAGIADAVNALHTSGVDRNGTAGVDFFTYTAGSAASTIAVNPVIVADPAKVAAASAPNQPGDGSIAGAIADLRNSRLFVGGTQTANDFYAGFVAQVGAEARQGDEMATNQGLVVEHLQQRRESFSGVSLDEEATDMIRFQHAYEAAARVITTIDEMLDLLINRTGTVGR